MATTVNSDTSVACPISAKKRATPSLPRQGSCHGAAPVAPSVAQSTSSVTTPRIVSTSPSPNAR